MAKDMTTGSPIKLIIWFSIPLVIGNIFQQLYNMVDAIVVGRYVGVDALAAVGSTGSLMFTLIGFSMGLTIGFSVIISQRFGAEDYVGMRRAMAMSIYLSVIISVVLTVVGICGARTFLTWTQTPAEIIDYAEEYLFYIFAGVIGGVFYNLFSSILRAVGDSKNPLYFLILASVLNIGLDLLFVVIFDMGTGGVGLATALAQGISAVVSVWYIWAKQPLLRLHKVDWQWDSQMVADLMKIGLPTGFQNSITGIGVLLMQSVVNSFGATVVAANTAGTKIQQLAIQPLMSIGMALATYVGQNLGAGNLKRIRKGVTQGAILTIVLALLGTTGCLLFGKQIALLFMSEPDVEVLDTAYTYLKVTTLFYPVLGCLFVYRYSLQGIGNAMVPMVSGFLELGLRLVIVLTVPRVIGYVGIPLADALAWVGAEVLLMVAYYRQIRRFEYGGKR